MKVTLNDVGSLTNEASALSTINTNSNSIENAIENTLSRDGTSPNEMEANLDMNSNRILNLPAPVAVTEPLRLQDLIEFTDSGVITSIPAGGETGQVLAKVSDDDYDVDWVSGVGISPELFGAVGDGVTNDTAAFQALGVYINANPTGVIVNHRQGANYFIWPEGGISPNLMLLVGVRGMVYNFNGSKFVTDNTFTAGNVGIFGLNDCRNVTFNDPQYEETAWTVLSATNGGRFFTINDTAPNWTQNLTINNAYQNGGSGFLIATTSTGARNGYANGIFINNAHIKNCNYGLNFAGNGNNVTARGIRGDHNGRIYFPYNVCDHDIEIEGIGGDHDQVLLTCYGEPGIPDDKKQLANIKLRYRVTNSGQPNGNQIELTSNQVVTSPTVSGAVNNGSGKVRLTVSSTADMLDGQRWFFNSIGGTTEANGFHYVDVINATTVDLTDVTFVNAYTSGGYARVPTAFKNLDIKFDIENRVDAVAGMPTFSTSKFTSVPAADTVPSGIEISNLKLSGNIRNYNNATTPAIRLFSDAAQGVWTSENIYNVTVEDLQVEGTSGSVDFNCAVISNGLFKNIKGGTGLTWNFTSPTESVQFVNIDTPAYVAGHTIGNASLYPTQKSKFIARSTTANSTFSLGQSDTNAMVIQWTRNAVPASAVAILATSGYNNPFHIDGSAVLINTNSSGTTTINSGGVAPTGTGAYVRATSPTLVTPALGTPASGVVTNLTGTASININGTVGATTRNTGAFTTVAANAGILNTSPTAGLGYATGAGSSVTQITSRSTTVTINANSGAITLFSAAGSASATAFTVVNSSVAVNDTISLSVRGATNIYIAAVSAVNAGNFQIVFYSASGVAVDAPIINFNVIKGTAT
jgi:hypothetical protein